MNNINPNPTKCATQAERIADYLKQGHTLTAMEALHMFGCFRLTSRICDIRRNYGWNIASERIVTPTGKRVARYRLISETQV